MVASNNCDVVAFGDRVTSSLCPAGGERVCCGGCADYSAAASGKQGGPSSSHPAGGEIYTMERDEFNEDASFYNVHGNPILECDFDRGVHILYDAIQKRDWGEVEKIFRESKAEVRRKPQGTKSRAEILAMAWVYRQEAKEDLRQTTHTGRDNDGDVHDEEKDDNGEEDAGVRLKWRIMALHAAVIFDAPIEILDKLLRANIYAAKLRDDRGNLPLHLAYKNGLDEDRMKLLLGAYRDGARMKNHKGLIPKDCSAFCRRGHIKPKEEEEEGEEVALVNVDAQEEEEEEDDLREMSMAVLPNEQKRSNGLCACAPLGACAPMSHGMQDVEEEGVDYDLEDYRIILETRDDSNAQRKQLDVIDEVWENDVDNESVDLNEYPLINTVISTKKQRHRRGSKGGGCGGGGDDGSCTIFSAISSDSERARKYYQQQHPHRTQVCGVLFC